MVEEIQINLGEEFLSELDTFLGVIKKSPAAFAKTGVDDFRQAVLKRFPYVIVFEVHGKEILVYSVFHTSRNPEAKFE